MKIVEHLGIDGVPTVSYVRLARIEIEIADAVEGEGQIAGFYTRGARSMTADETITVLITLLAADVVLHRQLFAG